jgi:hypothetical protein
MGGGRLRPSGDEVGPHVGGVVGGVGREPGRGDTPRTGMARPRCLTVSITAIARIAQAADLHLPAALLPGVP